MRHSRESMPSFPRRREPRIPALVWVYGRHPCPLCGCRGGLRTARRSRHPKRTPQPNDNYPLRHSRDSPYIDHMRHSRAEHSSFPRRREPRIPASVGVYGRHPCSLCGCRGGSRTARRSRHPKRIPKPNDNYPLHHSRDSPYIDCIRHSRAEYPSFPRMRSGPFSLEGRRLG